MSEQADARHVVSLDGAQALVEAGLPCLVAGGAVLGLATAQGGYFSTSWGWASTAFLWLLALWSIVSARTEVSRVDLLFGGLLTIQTAWIGASIAWSDAPALSVLELERALVALSGVLAALVLVRRRYLGWMIGTILVGITGIAAYGLATRLFPTRFDTFDPVAVYRLSEPIGYWNGLGILMVLGLVLAIGVVADAGSAVARALAAPAAVVMAVALYFTFSRGSWLALVVGLVVCGALSPRRLRFGLAALTTALPAGVGVLAASTSEALTTRQPDLSGAIDDGRRLAALLALLCLFAAASGVVFHVIDARASAPRWLRVAVAGGLALVVVVLCASAVARYGGPVTIAERTWNAFEAPPQVEGGNLNRRLLSFSGNGRVELWSGAADIYAEHRVWGSGAGTFERLWRERPDASQRVRDAHGLYIETLAELGPIGLVLLLSALAIPLVAAWRARRTPFAVGAAGGYVAFLVHAGVDWDWELSGVTLTALLLGCVVVVAARVDPARTIGFPSRLAVGLATGAAGFAALLGGLGNSSLAKSFSATSRGHLEEAVREAERARQLMPWSGRPLLARGEAELAAGDRAAAAASLRRSIAQDDGDWRAWLDLAIATRGAERRGALARARALYPTSTEIRRTAQALRDEGRS